MLVREFDKDVVKNYYAEIGVEEYLLHYRDAERFIKLCKECRNYGRRYGCPPFDYDVLQLVSRYDRVKIFGTQLFIKDAQVGVSELNRFMQPVVLQQNERLLELEKQHNGFACGFVGECPYCTEPCARLEGKPCRNSDKVRPSLEALGFDMVKTSKELLGVEIKWATAAHHPDYLMLICGLFY